MPLREVFPDRVAQRSIRTRTFHRRLDVLHALFDGFAYELILRRKMLVEPAVGQSRRGHDLRKSGGLNAAFIEFAGGHLHDSLPCLGRLFSRLSHLSTPFFRLWTSLHLLDVIRHPIATQRPLFFGTSPERVYLLDDDSHLSVRLISAR